MALSLADQCMLQALRRALDADPFADPICIGDAELSRAEARKAERQLDALAREARQAA